MDVHLRLHDRTRLQTPVRWYTHPAAGRRVTLLATMHVGNPGYYAGLRQVIADAEADGAVVQIEGARRLPNDPVDITDDEQNLLTDIRRWHTLEQGRIPLLGWSTQLDGLKYPPHWQIHDLSELDI